MLKNVYCTRSISESESKGKNYFTFCFRVAFFLNLSISRFIFFRLLKAILFCYDLIGFCRSYPITQHNFEKFLKKKSAYEFSNLVYFWFKKMEVDTMVVSDDGYTTHTSLNRRQPTKRPWVELWENRSFKETKCDVFVEKEEPSNIFGPSGCGLLLNGID